MGNLVKDTLYLSTNRGMYKRLYSIGIIAYVLLLVFSVAFYKERVIFLDTTFTILHMIIEGSFRIEVYRFGDLFSQILPVLAIKTGMPLDSVVMGYSVGFMAYYIICYLLCGSLLKQYDLALCVLLLNILFVSETFYWIPSEVPQGSALLIVVLAFMRNKQLDKVKPLTWSLLLAGMVTVAFFHVLLVFVLLFSVIFFLERRDLFASKRILFVIAAIYFSAIILKATAFRTHYERHAMGGLRNFLTIFPNYFNTFSNKRFLANCISNYYWIPVLFTTIAVLYIITKKWKQLFYFLCFFFGYLFLVNISYPTPATPLFYSENLYLPISVFLALPFVFDVLPVLNSNKLAVPIMVLILLSGCLRIYTTHNSYTSRLDHERRFLDKYGEQKVIVQAQKTDKDTLQILWGTPYELLLLSECERHKPASIIIDERPDKLLWATNLKNGLLVNWDILPYNKLPARYFNFTDTVSGYAIIK